MKGKLPFWAFYIGNPGLIQKLKVPKWVCRSPLASFCHGQPFFAIFGPTRGQIYGKKVEKIAKNYLFGPKAPSGAQILVSGALRRQKPAFGRLKAPLGPKRQFFLHFFTIFSAVFLNIWPLAGPNIAKKGGPLQKLARGDRQTHFGTFNFWLQPGFW